MQLSTINELIKTFFICIILLISSCSDEFSVKSETNKAINIINENSLELVEIINLSKEIKIRNGNKKLRVIIKNGNISCEQQLNESIAYYCVGSNWSSKEIEMDNKFISNFILDSIAIKSIIRINSFSSLTILNDRLEIRSDGLDIYFDLNIEINKNFHLKNIYDLNEIERPCNIEIGKGFSLYLPILEHGIS